MTRGGRWRALLVGLAAGVAGGLFGVGGGIIMIPLLTGWFGFSQHQAHGTSLAVVGVTALASLAVYGAYANVAWGTAVAVGVASVLFARFGARLAARTSPRNLTLVFASFLLLVAARLLWKAPEGALIDLGQGLLRAGFDVVLGAAVGLLAGYMGVGGGILAVPAFTLVLGMPQHVAQGTSLAVILMTAPAGALEHSRRGNLVWRAVPGLAIGAAFGGAASAWLVQGVPHVPLVRGFALFLLVNAGLTFLRVRNGDMGKLPRPASSPAGQ